MLDTVAADKTHRHHAVIEQVHADLKASALAHLPAGKFTANASWLVLAGVTMFLFFSNRHGCAGSILLSLAVTPSSCWSSPARSDA